MLAYSLTNPLTSQILCIVKVMSGNTGWNGGETDTVAETD